MSFQFEIASEAQDPNLSSSKPEKTNQAEMHVYLFVKSDNVPLKTGNGIRNITLYAAMMAKDSNKNLAIFPPLIKFKIISSTYETRKGINEKAK